MALLTTSARLLRGIAAAIEQYVKDVQAERVVN
jgi:hypothetical protein